MRKIAFVLAILGLWLVVGHGTVSADLSIHVYYSSATGELGIANAPGQPYMARDSAGCVLGTGTVGSAQFVAHVAAGASGPLVVQVGGGQYLAIDTERDAWWQ